MKKSMLRIISGKYRGRKISFNQENNTIRPTLNIVRETLFNWIAKDLPGSNCLDLFAGSGIFCFEALSRGANYALAIEKNYSSYSTIIENKIKLKINSQDLGIINQDALLALKDTHLLLRSSPKIHNKQNYFNLVFLDPPYNNNELLLLSLNALVDSNLIIDQSKIYFECNDKGSIFKEKLFPNRLELLRSNKSGKVYFYLLQFNQN